MNKDIESRVREDIRCHKENGVDLNPFSTPSMRWSWQNGFNGTPEVLLDYADAYDRGRFAAKLIEEESE